MPNTSFDIVEHEEFLEFIVHGEPSESDWVKLLHTVVEKIGQTTKPRIFIDGSKLTTATDPMTRYRMGVRTGATFGIDARIAVLQPSWMDDNFWETVATNRGAMARSSTDREKLMEWLLDTD